MTLASLVDDLIRTAAVRGTRALLVVEAPRDARAPATPVPDRADWLTARLGTENPRLLHDTRERLDPALLAAEAGTVPAGGVLVLVIPPPDDTLPGSARSPFRARLARLLAGYIAEEPGTSARVALSAEAVETLPHGLADAVPVAVATVDALDAQERLLERALAHLGHTERPLIVIEAPRGHGKAAWLGRHAAAREHAGAAPAVTAARRPATDVLERHRLNATPGRLAPLPFLAPDAALASGGDTLLVDEAASLPLPVLEGLLARWRRLVFATTSAGYENAGRAFALRLPAILDRERPGWLRLTPPEPMRWRTGDPLDALLARVNLASASLVAPSADTLEELAHRPVTRVDRHALADDEERLASLHGLLVATHYQSTPLDLVHLLDAPTLALWSVEHAGRACAVALVTIEPGTATDLHAAILARRRRLPHRLLPQLLAQSANRADALAASHARIVRIAVHPDARRRGVASRLVEAVTRDTRAEVEAIGASFGETPATRAFWAANGFTTFHRGYRRNPRSGRRALAVLRAGSARTRDVLAVAAAIHRDNALAEAANPMVSSPPVPSLVPPVGTPGHDLTLLHRFASGERSLADTRAALGRFARDHHRSTTTADGNHGASTDPDGERDAAERLLHALGLPVPPSPKRREATLRDWVRDRLDARD